MVTLLAVLLAGILGCYHTQHPLNLLADTEVDYLDSLRTYEVVLCDYPSAHTKTMRYTAEVLAIVDSTVVPATGRAYLYLRKDSLRAMPTMGDTLLVRTRIRRGGRIGNFDYGLYLRRQGITGQAFASSKQWRTIAPHNEQQTQWQPVQWQHALLERYRKAGIGGAEAGTVAALTLGYKEDLDPDIERSFQKAGAAHILAVSGLHTGIIYTLLVALLTLGGRVRPLYKQRLWQCVLSGSIIAGLAAYAAMTGGTPSVVRSVLMLTLMEIAVVLHREAFSLNTLAAAAVLILSVRPLDLFSVSFQLSFMAVLGILVLLPLFPFRLPGGKGKAHSSRAIVRRIGNYFVGIVAVSLAAQLGTLPLTLYYFGQCSNYFLLTNLIVIPLAFVIVSLGVLLLGISGLASLGCAGAWLVRGVADALTLSVRFLNESVGWIERLPGSVTTMRISLPMVFLLYGAIACGYLSLRRSLWYLLPTAVCLTLFCYLYTTV